MSSPGPGPTGEADALSERGERALQTRRARDSSRAQVLRGGPARLESRQAYSPNQLIMFEGLGSGGLPGSLDILKKSENKSNATKRNQKPCKNILVRLQTEIFAMPCPGPQSYGRGRRALRARRARSPSKESARFLQGLSLAGQPCKIRRLLIESANRVEGMCSGGLPGRLEGLASRGLLGLDKTVSGVLGGWTKL